MRCPNCNTQVGAVESFCGKCGAHIARSEDPIATAVDENVGKTPFSSGTAAVVISVVILVVVCLCLVATCLALDLLAPNPTTTGARATDTAAPRILHPQDVHVAMDYVAARR